MNNNNNHSNDNNNNKDDDDISIYAITVYAVFGELNILHLIKASLMNEYCIVDGSWSQSEKIMMRVIMH